MVRIVNYQKRQTETGKEFFVLEIQGGVEMVKSQETGKFYVTARKATISSTFDEMTCQALIGTELPGSVEKVECTPYEYTIRDTGEVITLHHRFEYVEEVKEVKATTKPVIEKAKEEPAVEVDDYLNMPVKSNTFSTNGQLVH